MSERRCQMFAHSRKRRCSEPAVSITRFGIPVCKTHAARIEKLGRIVGEDYAQLVSIRDWTYS